jgi:hypothetical protein
MKNKIVIGIIITLVALSMIPKVNAASTISGDIGISNLSYAMEAESGQGTLYLWWLTNDASKAAVGLQVNISVNGQVIGTTSANSHLNLGSAWTFDEFSQVFGTEGSYEIIVQFTNFTDPESKNTNTGNDKVERTIYVGDGILSAIVGGAYDIYFMVDDAIPNTGVDIIDNLPMLPILIAVIIIIVVIVLYKRHKKKKTKKGIGAARHHPYGSPSYNVEKKNYPPYGGRPPTYYDDYNNEFY